MINFSSQFKIGDRSVGRDSPVYIIAEAGVSHFGDESKAYKLVDMAADSGADAVKFQVFDIDEMIATSQSDWRSRLGSRQLSYDAFVRIQQYCLDRGITFFATAHDNKSLDFLHEIDPPVYKIGSGELANDQYFRKVAQYDKPVIFSTGMYRYHDIESALNIFSNEEKTDVAVLHCITSYPTDPKDVGLLNINKIRDRYGVISGYSDHTEGFHLPLAAVAQGAKIIEKHITLEFDIPNAQDWKVSCGPQNLSTFVQQIRDIEKALTFGHSGPTKEEQENKLWATKSLVLTESMLKGDVIRESSLTTKRPGTGIVPTDINKVIGKKINIDLNKDSILLWRHLQ